MPWLQAEMKESWVQFPEGLGTSRGQPVAADLLSYKNFLSYVIMLRNAPFSLPSSGQMFLTSNVQIVNRHH